MNSSINEESSHSHIVDDSSDLPLTIGITSDGANVLRGKKNGIQKKIKNVANQLMLSSHCILHRFELSTKSVMEKNNRSLKDLFQFLEKLLKYHHNCTVVTAVFHKTVKVYDITGATSVIRMNETRSISHVTLALLNFQQSRSRQKYFLYICFSCSLQKCLIKLGEFYNNPNSRENWKKWESIIGKSAKGIVLDEKSRQLVAQQLRHEIKDAMIYQQKPT